MSHHSIKTEKDKWYISEGFKGGIRPSSYEFKQEMIDHNQGTIKMILAGPFYTREDADAELLHEKYKEFYEPFVWQCTSDMAE
ncbi:hypothetical protein V6x_37430 [Gimesia chilikensis]|uniref:Uncharacterized protein n=1 Tax=Gimesia chilikensis TaxID=2605989 RepID=A0A517WFH3_9PLAN|nr:hypothetical protein [Gimesia chilikensis]QDU04018.1 hypothetical protein V6x_37430 [Gimesia chilikensis]